MSLPDFWLPSTVPLERGKLVPIITSGQIIIFHQPGKTWNKGISLTKPPFGVRSCEVAIIWPDHISTPLAHPPLQASVEQQPYSQVALLIKWSWQPPNRSFAEWQSRVAFFVYPNGCWTKNRSVKPPKSSHLFIGFFPYFRHPFWGKTHYFWKYPNVVIPFNIDGWWGYIFW